MIRLKGNTDSPLDYSLCDQVVTIYHRSGVNSITRTVHERTFLDYKKVESVDKTGSKDSMSFLLVIPGEHQLHTGDKVFPGKGPEITTDEEWRKFIPANNPGLCVISYVDPKQWHGKVCHMEAGG